MPLRTLPELKPLTKRYQGLTRALAFVGAYGLWVVTSRLLILTLITFFVRGADGQLPSFEEINDTFISAQLSFVGIAALAFVLILKWFNPLAAPGSEDEIFSPARFEGRFLPAFAWGALLAAALVLAFILTGHYQYIGFFIQFEELPSALLGIALRVASLGVLVYCEEYVFRHKITRYLRLPERTLGGELITALVVAAGYCAIRDLQFDLGVAQLATAFLISVALSLRSYRYEDFVRGAGYLAGIVLVFQPLLSLPLFGGDFSGLLLVKPQPGMEGLSRLITGGAGGPFSSFAFQIILLLDIIRSAVTGYRKVEEEGAN